LLSLTIRLPFEENRWSILNNFLSRRCFFIHACLWPASGLPLARLWPADILFTKIIYFLTMPKSPVAQKNKVVLFIIYNSIYKG